MCPQKHMDLLLSKKTDSCNEGIKGSQGCALEEPGGPCLPIFALGRLENLRLFIQIICWHPGFGLVQSTGLHSIFLRAQHWKKIERELICFFCCFVLFFLIS